MKAAWARGAYDSEEHRKKLSDVQKKACQRPEVKRKKSEAAKKSWQDPEVWEKHSQSMKAAHARGDHDNSEAMKEAWARGAYDGVLFTPEVEEKRIQAIREAHQTPEVKEIKSKAAKQLWQDPEYRQSISEARKASWAQGIYDKRDVSGENNPSWKGGLSYEPYGPDFSDELKQYVRARDDYKCAMCDIPEDGHAHHCHHLDYDKTNNDPTNLLTLCRPCHTRTNHNRRFWRTILAPVARRREEAWTRMYLVDHSTEVADPWI